jgi:hypothetical protein
VLVESAACVAPRRLRASDGHGRSPLSSLPRS